MFKNLPQHLRRIQRLGHDFNVRFIFKQVSDPLPQQAIIMRHYATNLITGNSFFWLRLSVKVHRRLPFVVPENRHKY